MAQVSVFEWYKQDMPVGFPGMKADSTLDVIDSFAAETALNPGEAVIRGTNDGQVKPVAAAADISSVIGIAVHTHKAYEGSGEYYEVGYNLPVMTFGDVYVQVNDTVAAGGAVAILVDGDGVNFVASGTSSGSGDDEVTATDVTGMTYLASGVAGDIVPVRIRL